MQLLPMHIPHFLSNHVMDPSPFETLKQTTSSKWLEKCRWNVRSTDIKTPSATDRAVPKISFVKMKILCWMAVKTSWLQRLPGKVMLNSTMSSFRLVIFDDWRTIVELRRARNGG